MATISDKDRAEAQAMFEAYYGRGALAALSINSHVRRWLAVRDHVLASHTCPDDRAKRNIKLATQAHTCGPTWRPTTRDEIQAGWEVRSRGRDGFEMNWGVAHHQDADGSWRTEAGALLTHGAMRWTYETTAPLPEPEPDPRIRVVVEWSKEPACSTDGEAAIDLLARLDALTGGEQS